MIDNDFKITMVGSILKQSETSMELKPLYIKNNLLEFVETKDMQEKNIEIKDNKFVFEETELTRV